MVVVFTEKKHKYWIKLVDYGEEMYEWLQEQILNEMKMHGASVFLYNALNLSSEYDSMNDV